MSDTARGVALLLSVLLWSPVLPGLLTGGTSAEQALMVYAAALVLSLVGCGGVAAIVRGYAPDHLDRAEPAEVDLREEAAA